MDTSDSSRFGRCRFTGRCITSKKQSRIIRICRFGWDYIGLGGLGFPVTADFFESAALNALNDHNPVANLFEAAWNVVSLTFIVLVYKWRGSLSVSLR